MLHQAHDLAARDWDALTLELDTGVDSIRALQGHRLNADHWGFWPSHTKSCSHKTQVSPCAFTLAQRIARWPKHVREGIVCSTRPAAENPQHVLEYISGQQQSNACASSPEPSGMSCNSRCTHSHSPNTAVTTSPQPFTPHLEATQAGSAMSGT